MLRYFFALSLPEYVRERLATAQPRPSAGVRLTAPDDFHITLHFLGPLNDESVTQVVEAAQTVDAAGFDLTIDGLGQFPNQGPAKVLWAGVQLHPAIVTLYQTLGEALQLAIDFQPESRPYTPHITLARINGPVSSNWLQQFFSQPPLAIDGIKIDEFVLYSSDTAKGRPVYRPVATFVLQPAVPPPL